MDSLARHLGSRHEWRITVRPEHTVPALPVDSPTIAAMPAVLATPMLIAMAECACTAHLGQVAPEAGLSLGAEVEIAHTAPTPVGMTVTVTTELLAVEGRLVRFSFTAHDGLEAIGHGRHTRAIVPRERFAARLAEKQARVG
jgi:fluoroacetyl-CoA thioesterase